MLVSVTERTREIECKALGARQRDVLLQFLIESATLAMTGGAIGVICGVLLAKLITVIIGFPTSVQLWSVALGLFVAGATGIFFGVYPASKGGEIDPVVKLCVQNFEVQPLTISNELWAARYRPDLGSDPGVDSTYRCKMESL